MAQAARHSHRATTPLRRRYADALGASAAPAPIAPAPIVPVPVVTTHGGQPVDYNPKLEVQGADDVADSNAVTEERAPQPERCAASERAASLALVEAQLKAVEEDLRAERLLLVRLLTARERRAAARRMHEAE